MNQKLRRCSVLLFLGLIVSISGHPSSQAKVDAQPVAGVEPCKLPDPPTPNKLEKPKGTIWFAPAPPAYPYGDAQEVTRQARCISTAFENYVKAWMDGKAPAEIPRQFLPPGTNFKDFSSFRLVRESEIDPQRQWAVRPAHTVDQNQLYGSYPDPHATYLMLPALYAPFGTKVIIEGEFPHARFFDIQLTPSFDPKNYHYDGAIGVGEVPLVDADIEPLPGHTNPYRVGANRKAEKRGYRVEYTMAIGDPVKLNPAFRPPHFRGQGNKRIGGAIMFQGPWGAKNSDGHKRGVWDVGQLWLRYYAPDKGTEPLAGVPLPKVTYKLPDGRKYFVEADIKSFLATINRRVALTKDEYTSPDPKLHETEEYGWFKQTGIFRSIMGGIASGTGWGGKEYVRQLDKGVAGRGEDLPAPNNYEQSATSATYIDYLVRGVSLDKGQIVVLKGKLPTYPATRGGKAVMPKSEVRYWSITGYHVPIGLDFLGTLLGAKNPSGVEVHSVMDDEIKLDANRNYTLVFSRAQDRPVNATRENGVTWVDWGHSGRVSWTLRWLTVGPEWKGPMTPSHEKLGWTGDGIAEGFKESSISKNTHQGALGPYLPVVDYMTKAEFEAKSWR